MSKVVQPALERRLDADPSKATAQLLAASQLLEQLPVEPMPSLPLSPHIVLARGLAAYCDVLAQRVDTAGVAQRQQQAALRHQLVRQLLACMAKLPGMLHFRAGPALADSNLKEVSALCMSLLVPGDIAVELSGFNASLGGSRQAAGGGQRPAPPTEQDATVWCTSAAAALRAVPLLVQARQQLQRSGAAGWQQRSVAGMLSHLSTLAHFAGIASMGAMVPRTRFARPAALHQALFALHTACCRLVAWCDANREAGALPLDAESVLQQLAAVSGVLVAALQLHLMEEDDACRAQDLQSMALAHWSALRVLAPAAADSSFPPWRLNGLTASLAACIGMGPTLLSLDAELHCLYGQIFDRVPQRAMPFALRSTLVTARHGPPLAVHLLLSGRLGRMVESVLQLCAANVFSKAEALNLLACAHNLSQGLHSAAQAVLESQGAADAAHPDAGPLAALSAAQLKLSSVLQLGRVHMEEAAAALQGRVLPLCRDVAAALQAWWQRPEQQPALQLEAAQAAARRSCAFLRCANLGGEGGPAAGEGVGSMRCSACRAVWYCGTACSHADWRAGHRRVCKALGAARAAEKERRRQQEGS